MYLFFKKITCLIFCVKASSTGQSEKEYCASWTISIDLPRDKGFFVAQSLHKEPILWAFCSSPGPSVLIGGEALLLSTDWQRGLGVGKGQESSHYLDNWLPFMRPYTLVLIGGEDLVWGGGTRGQVSS